MKYSKEIKILVTTSAVLLMLPKIIFATGFGGMVDSAFGIIFWRLIPLAFGICLLYFFWGVFKFIKAGGSGNERAIQEGKRFMLWGIIALFVVFSIWGIIRFMRDQLGFPIGGADRAGLVP